MILFSKWEHGGKPISIDTSDKTFRVDGKKFHSWKETASYLYGRPVTVPFQEYFKPFKYEQYLSFREEISEAVQQEIEQEIQEITALLQKRYGVDLSERFEDVTKLVYSLFYNKVSSRYEIEDILQEVFAGLLVRNQGKCPWDHEKSSLGHYVHMVASCVISNYHAKQSKHFDNVVLDSEPDLEEYSSDLDGEDEYLVEQDLRDYVISQVNRDPDTTYTVYSLMLKGHKINEISKLTGISNVSKQVHEIRSCVARWAAQRNLTHLVPARLQEVSNSNV